MDEDFSENIDERKITPYKVITMIDMYLKIFKNPVHQKTNFKSLSHLGRVYENSTVIKPFLKELLSDMLHWRILIINEQNFIIFDEDRFNDFIQTSKMGNLIINYVDEISTLRLP